MSYSVKSVSLGVFLWLRQAGNMDLFCNEVATTRCPLFCPKSPGYASALQYFDWMPGNTSSNYSLDIGQLLM